MDFTYCNPDNESGITCMFLRATCVVPESPHTSGISIAGMADGDASLCGSHPRHPQSAARGATRLHACPVLAKT